MDLRTSLESIAAKLRLPLHTNDPHQLYQCARALVERHRNTDIDDDDDDEDDAVSADTREAALVAFLALEQSRDLEKSCEWLHGSRDEKEFATEQLTRRHLVQTTPTMPSRYRRQYWEAFCERNDERWVTTHVGWRMMWDLQDGRLPGGPLRRECSRGSAESRPLTLVEDAAGRGFVALLFTGSARKSDVRDFDVELYFALVDREHRRAGVLRALFERVRSEHAGKLVWLECAPEVAVVWERLGFEAKGWLDAFSSCSDYARIL
jgi:GNAT superfamily N-acetyltransferase